MKRKRNNRRSPSVGRNKLPIIIIIIIMLTNSSSSSTITTTTTTTAYGNYKVACAIERKIKLMMQFIIFPFLSSFFFFLSSNYLCRLNSGHGTGYSLFIAAATLFLFDSSLSHRLSSTNSTAAVLAALAVLALLCSALLCVQCLDAMPS